MKIIRLTNVIRVNNLIKSVKLVGKAKDITILLKGRTPKEVIIEIKKWALKKEINIKDIETVTF